MTAIGYDGYRAGDRWTEAKAAMQEAMQSKGVMAVAIVCATILGLGLLGVLGWLAYAQRDAATLVSIVNTFINVFLLKKVADMNGRVGNIESQTNGNTKRLLDAALPKSTD